jgi:hypothetical protein
MRNSIASYHRFPPVASICVASHERFIAENSVRPMAVARKNWIHFGSQEVGPRGLAQINYEMLRPVRKQGAQTPLCPGSLFVFIGEPLRFLPVCFSRSDPTLPTCVITERRGKILRI